MEVPAEPRIERVQEKMKDAETDLALFTPGPNMQYLTGFEAESSGRHMFLAVPSTGEPGFFTPELVREEVKETGINATFWKDDKNVISELEKFLHKFSAQNVLLDDKMWEMFSKDVRGILGNAEIGLTSSIMDEIRAVKSEQEIERIRSASDIADLVVEDVRNIEITGMSEIELRDFIEEKMDEYGGEGPSFDTIVASGPNSSSPHHQCSSRVIESDDPVTMDFGCWINGYPSDQTRTVVAGDENPSEKLIEVFEIVKKAQQLGIEAVEPGVQDKKIDRVVRNFIESKDYGDDFIHRTGHGVGIEIHESPKIPPKNHEISMKLKPGMVFSVEPGIYLEDLFGVRIEDLVLVTEDGCERLNRTSRDYSTNTG